MKTIMELAHANGRIHLTTASTSGPVPRECAATLKALVRRMVHCASRAVSQAMCSLRVVTKTSAMPESGRPEVTVAFVSTWCDQKFQDWFHLAKSTKRTNLQFRLQYFPSATTHILQRFFNCSKQLWR